MNPQTMATVAESSEAMPTPPSSDYSIGSTITKNLGETMPWVEHAVQQAQLYQKAVEEAIDSAVEASKSRLSEIRSTSSAHLHQTIGSLQDLKSEYASYEEVFFGKIKEGVVIAASHPVITSGVAAGAGLGLMVLQRPWHSLYYRARYKAMRLFLSQEAILSRADSRVKELQKSIDSLKAESETLEVILSLPPFKDKTSLVCAFCNCIDEINYAEKEGPCFCKRMLLGVSNNFTQLLYAKQNILTYLQEKTLLSNHIEFCRHKHYHILLVIAWKSQKCDGLGPF